MAKYSKAAEKKVEKAMHERNRAHFEAGEAARK
jgi:hypothetical protein